ncbi:unnamed protein product [Calypogeia fissa]
MERRENLPPLPPGGQPGTSAAPRQAGLSGQPGPSSASGMTPLASGLPRAAPSGVAGTSKPTGSAGPRFKQMTRNGDFGKKGNPTPLLTNHYKVTFNPAGDVHHYNVTINPVTKKVVSRMVMEKLYETFGREFLNGKRFAYDGEKSLFTVGPLPFNSHQFPVHLDDEPGRGRRGGNSVGVGGGSPGNEEGRPSQRRRTGGRDFDVEIKFAAKVNMSAIQAVLKGTGEELPQRLAQDALRVLDIMLREHAARRGYLLIRDSYFHSSLGKGVGEIGDGVQSWNGFHCSFRPTSGGCLTLNFDLSTTTVIKPSPVVKFIQDYFKKDIKHVTEREWDKVKRILKGIQVETYSGRKQKIFALSPKPCHELTFEKKKRDPNGELSGTEEITVADYFQKERNLSLQYPQLYALDLGRTNKPVYVPIELCKILEGQRYKRNLTGIQRKNHIDCARKDPDERKDVCERAIAANDYNNDELVKEFNVNIEPTMVKVRGRILDPPSLLFGRNREEKPTQGKWNFNNKEMKLACEITKWAVANFCRGPPATAAAIASQLKAVCTAKGMKLSDAVIFNEERNMTNRNPEDRINDMMRQLSSYKPTFILAILPEKSSQLYAPLKKVCETRVGIVSQCIVPPRQLKDQYLTNVALKINLKWGGYNTLLAHEEKKMLPKVSQVPTCIFGLDVSHGSPGDASSPSIAAAVASTEWPKFSKYAARVRAQPPKTEMIEGLYEEGGSDKGGGMVIELLKQFFSSCRGPTFESRKPQQIVIYRDGVSESQFQQVLETELMAFKKGLKALESNSTSNYNPKVTLIVVQKRHHTRFFPANGTGNVKPGTIVDTDVCHPRDNDFFLCSHAGLIGTSRPTHYHVLYDEIGFTSDELQQLTHCLCYSYARCTTAVSVAAPAYYAHLAAQHCRNFVNNDGSGSETSSKSGRAEPVQALPTINSSILNKMFYT